MSTQNTSSKGTTKSPLIVDEALTRKVAELSRLALTDSEVTLFTEQMKKTLSYIDSITSVDTSGIEPQYHSFEMDTPMREDVIVPQEKTKDGKSKVLEHAPSKLYDGFKVPPIL